MMVGSLPDLTDHLNDYDWLDEHIDDFFQQITGGLEYPSSAQEAIGFLNLIMPYALTRHDYIRWLNTLYEALLHAMNLKDEEIQIQIWSHLGNCLFQKGDYKSATTTFEKALQRSEIEATPETVLLASIGMLRTKTIYETYDIHTFIAETLDAAREVDNYHLLGQLHHTLAVAYGHQAETQKALGHGQIALACWYREANQTEKERTILILAEVCRVAMRYGQAARFLDLIEPGTENAYMTGCMYYHRGSAMLETGQLDDARMELEQALELFRTLDFPYMTGAAHHVLGLIQTKLNDHASAHKNLRHALITWQKLDNSFQQVSCIYAIGFLEEYSGRIEEARSLYERALELSVDLPASPALTDLCAELNDRLSKLGA